MSVRISNDVVKKLIGKHIVDSINKHNIVDMIVGVLDSSSLEAFVNVCISDEEYKRVNIGDIVSFSMDGSDNLRDHHLLSEDKTRYGIVKGSDNYGGDWNAFYYKMNINVFDLDENDNIIIIDTALYTNELTHVDQDTELWQQLMNYKQTIKER